MRPLLRAFMIIALIASMAGVAGVAAAAPGGGGKPKKPPKPPTTAPPSFTPGVALLDNSGTSTLAAEPTLQVDSKGNVYVTGPAGVPNGGCPFWWVHPGTLNAQSHVYDYRGKIDTDHESVGGGDCDVSILPSGDPTAKFDPISVSSLSLANLTTNVSSDGGATWRDPANPVGQQIFNVDRQWQASDPGLGYHYLTVHDSAVTNIQTSVSTDGGYVYVQNTPAIQPQFAPGAASANNGNHFGALAVDPTTHKLYIPFIGAATDEVSGGSEHVVYVAVGDPCANGCTKGAQPGPIAWENHVVYTGPVGQRLSHDFPALTLDKGGNIYIGWAGDTGASSSASATNRIWLSKSTVADPSKWSAPAAVDDGTNHSNMFPWLSGGNAGVVDIAWYGGKLNTGLACATPTDAEGVNDNCQNEWRVDFAQSTDGGATFTRSAASGVIHRGSICDEGLGCDLTGGDRTLLDYFDMDIDPQGGANIAYVSDFENPGTAVINYTRQCGGTSTVGTQLSRNCGPLQPAAVGLPATTCDGANAVPDTAGDAATVFGTTQGAESVDITNVAFANAGTNITVKMSLTDLELTPAPPMTVQSYRIAWTAPDGKQYGVEAEVPSALGNYTAGPWDGANNQVTGGTAVTGTMTTGPNGTITWTVPKSLIGNPTVPVAAGQAPAVGAPYALTTLGEGSSDVGYVYWPADQAPNSGTGSSWSVC